MRRFYLPSALFCLMLAGLFLFTTLSGTVSAEIPWQDKVEPDLLDMTRGGESAEFIVMFAAQADVSAAYSLNTKAEKGRYVYDMLSQHATATQTKAIDLLERQNAEYRSYWINNTLLVNGTSSVLQALAELPSVAHITTNPQIRNSFPQTEPLRTAPTAATWGVEHINADDVWSTLNITGTGAVIGGQDTGYKWDHVDLQTQYRGWDGTSADHNYNWHDSIHAIVGSGPNPCGLDSVVPCDDFDHGTHTLGTMVGGNASGTDIGVAPGAAWIGCRNMERGNGTPATYTECFEWFLAPTDLNNDNADPLKAPHAITNSWHCPTGEGCNSGNFAAMETAIDNLRAAGVVVVVAASNRGSFGCSSIISPPAIFDGSFAVGSFTQSGSISGFSSRGPVTNYGATRMKPDIAAPGSSVYSTDIDSVGYSTKSGTSMAAPHVTGVIALMISANPALAGNVDAIEQILRDTTVERTTTQGCGDDTDTSVPNNVFGYGEVDALAAVQAAQGEPVSIALDNSSAVAASSPAYLMLVFAAFGMLSVFLLKRPRVKQLQ